MIELRGVSKTVQSGGRPLTILHPLDFSSIGSSARHTVCSMIRDPSALG